MTDDSEEGSENGSVENESVEDDNGGEGSSSVATTPSAPEGATPNGDTKDAGEIVEEGDKSEAGESDAPPKSPEGEVSSSSHSSVSQISIYGYV